LTVDQKENTIYWASADSDDGVIELANLDGSGRYDFFGFEKT